MWRYSLAVGALSALMWPVAAFAQEDDRAALRRILSDVRNAINAQDVEGIVAQMDPKCTVTWWNAEVSRGHDEIRAYYRRMG